MKGKHTYDMEVMVAKAVAALAVACMLAACVGAASDAVFAGVAGGESQEPASAEEAISEKIEVSQGVREAGWYVDNDGDVFYIGEGGTPLTGWWYLSGHWFHFEDDGAATKGWIAWRGEWRYCSQKTGAVATNAPVEGAYWAGADGSLTPVEGMLAQGGTTSWTAASGTDRAKFVAYLTAHALDYLGTIYDSWPCSVPGTGMHCAGFVDRALYDAGFAYGFWNDLSGTGYESYSFNNGYLYRPDEDPYSNENCWHVGGWAMWMNGYGIRWRAYRTHEDAMAGAQRGEFQKGDIIIYSTSDISAYDYSGVEHIAFYWGDEDNWSLIWESSPENDNAIVERSEYTSMLFVLTST